MNLPRLAKHGCFSICNRTRSITLKLQIIKNLIKRVNINIKPVKYKNIYKEEKMLEDRYFKKLSILLYTDSRGSDIIKDLSYDFYTTKLKNKYDLKA